MAKALRDWWQQPGHFYWITAFLAARGAQVFTCRAVALYTLGIGAISLAMLWSPNGPDGILAQSLVIGVAVCCTLKALVWMRNKWPTRGWSGAYAVTTSVCIAVSCLAQSNPVAGLLGTTTFAALAGFIAFFHTARFLAFNLIVTAATAVFLAVRVAEQNDAVWAACALALVAVANLAVPFGCQAVVHLLDIDVLNTEIDPLTGLLNREAFYRTTGEFVAARARIDDRYLVIVLVSLDNFTLLTGTDGKVSGDRAEVAVAQTLRETTRSNAIVAHVGEAEFLIADTFATTDASPLVERVRGAIATTPPRLTASIGVVATPMRGLADCPPHELMDELVVFAEEAMADARRAGGNMACTVVCSMPTVLAEKNTWDRFDDEPR
ncbi:GGDEF domain-containing protein [Mycolicibacterium komossense]|uniref:GGDEF domain-containing protein n=1 Tax=Mycolicibacterium komossense TaxID=1779 RepID=A0ABT3CIB4_9MYCO|nr:GGDEF domain-containing protein [Mycolicibacterium komossense]MCV7229210.1 GGDEF domain-containing protein [Mycolicibacterium komossense]